ncbi:hypothetical protein [Paraburkholderia terrae]|uniref:hypothetical protein n=1 Tax=Paraburkholderia terrae TaxID=311230 RepID=UPI001EE37DF9|nr:hypothetical protein [Paraburkholderia terrae]GJH02279.1 hypothetical protein CBA19C8_17000 [Paraburkholderia terrae]
MFKTAQEELEHLQLQKSVRAAEIARGWYNDRPMSQREAAMHSAVSLPFKVLHQVPLDNGQMHTMQAPKPAEGETFFDYGNRLLRDTIGEQAARKVKRDPSDFSLVKYQADVLNVARQQIEDLPRPIEIVTRDPAGRNISDFYGGQKAMASWMNEFKGPIQRQVSIDGKVFK